MEDSNYLLKLISKASCGAHFSTQHEAHVVRNPGRFGGMHFKSN